MITQRVSSTGTVSSRVAVFFLSLTALALMTACGSSSSLINGVSCPGSTGSYSKALLGTSGTQWVYSLSGQQYSGGLPNGPFTEAGYFVVDGNGSITSGLDDGFGAAITGGSYRITSNGTGTINLNITGFGTVSWAVSFTGSSPSSFYVIEADNNGYANTAGIAYQQSGVTTAPPTGTFVFRTHVTSTGLTVTGSISTVGVMNVNSSGTITGLNEDVLLGGQTAQQLTLSGGAFAPTTIPGVGTVTITNSASMIVNYNYYMIDANTVLLDGNSGIGRMEAQTGGPFTNSSLAANAGFAFGSHGDSNGTLSGTGTPGAGGVNTVGAFTVDGAGTVTGGSLDSVQDGNPSTSVSISGGNYNADPSGDGRYTISLTASSGTILDVFYMVSPTRGFFLVNDTTDTTVQDGTADQQTTTSTLTGQFAFVMAGSELASPANFLDRTGTITTDGSGNLGWAEVANSDGTASSPGCLAGTYASTGSNGRFAATVSGLPADLVMYAISANKAYILQDDSLVQLYGGMSLQSGAVVDPPGTLLKRRAGH